MNIDDLKLMAYADGELTREEARSIEAAMAADPDLAARVQRFRDVRQALRAAYDPIVSEPTPAHLLALIAQDAAPSQEAPDHTQSARADESANVTTLDAARERRRLRFAAPAWTAIAASLMLGVLVGRMAAPASTPFAGAADDLRAAGALARALESGLAADGSDAATRLGVTFRAQDGGYCRTFAQTEGEATVSGLACRERENWAVRVAQWDRAGEGTYRQAGVAPAIYEAVDALIDGEPFTAEQERAARDRGWRD